MCTDDTDPDLGSFGKNLICAREQNYFTSNLQKCMSFCNNKNWKSSFFDVKKISQAKHLMQIHGLIFSSVPASPNTAASHNIVSLLSCSDGEYCNIVKYDIHCGHEIIFLSHDTIKR